MPIVPKVDTENGKQSLRQRIGEANAQVWLEVVMKAGWLKPFDMKYEYDECGQLLALFATIAKNC
jgi:hypothetical protein